MQPATVNKLKIQFQNNFQEKSFQAKADIPDSLMRVIIIIVMQPIYSELL